MSDLARQELIDAKWQDLSLLQEHYSEFEWFLQDVIEDLLGFTCTEVQYDIGEFVSKGPKYRMVQAQRGQAKTTITAAYAVWRLIHDPATRVLIVSAGSDMATEISNWILQIINNMEVLECLRPDRLAGDRSSVQAFDVHWALKGPEKSPSVACVGITSNMQGKRADILIADDIESAKNSQTATMRLRLLHLTRDFTSICSNGDIIYLGTPQSIDSVYNTLPGRGFIIRVWPGRYPTRKERIEYEGYLAPYIQSRLDSDPSLGSGGGASGDRGKPVDPVLLDEDALTKKEIDQGASYFQLQHMLSTKLSDADRFPLKLQQVRFFAFDRENMKAPMTLQHVPIDSNLIKPVDGFPITDRMYRVQEADDFTDLAQPHMYVDPTGGGSNGDELAYAVTSFLAGRVFLLDFGGHSGGITDDNLDWLTNLAKKWKPFKIDVEKNYGNGALASVWAPRLAKEYQCHVEDVWETGQKELRIIDILEPVVGAGKLVVHESLIEDDWNRCQQYPAEKRGTYSFFLQFSRITRDKAALTHDDRLDAVAGSVRHWVEMLRMDDQIAAAKARSDAYKKMIKDPLGNGRPIPGFDQQNLPNVFNKQRMGRNNQSALRRHLSGFR